MAYAGQVLKNPVTGETITILETSEQTGGEKLVFDCRVTPGGSPLPPHVHSTQEERFEVWSGELGVMLGGKKQVLRAGDRIALPAGVKHQWWVAGEEEVQFRVEVSPPRNLEATLEAVCGMAQAGKLNKKAMPRNPFLLANLGRFSETYIPVVPIWMQRMGLTMGSLTGRLFGIDPEFRQYRAPAPEVPALEEALA
ncbi:MAG TPA: cupin domain-containing protein [Chloroflexota bacterium]